MLGLHRSQMAYGSEPNASRTVVRHPAPLDNYLSAQYFPGTTAESALAPAGSSMPPFDYLNPAIPAGLRRVVMPVVDASDASLGGYGHLVDSPEACDVEIVRWPAQGWRPVDTDSGDEGGTTEGVFVSEWRGDVLYGRNEAVDGHYVLAYADEPTKADTAHARDPSRMLLWHVNYHPDGGDLSFRFQPMFELMAMFTA
jgi:hypothetical protein